MNTNVLHMNGCLALALGGGPCTCQHTAPPTEMVSLREIKQRLAAIEQQLHTPESYGIPKTLGEVCQQTQDEQVGFAGRLSAIEQGQAPLLAALDDGFERIERQNVLLCERLDALGKEILATQDTPSLGWRFDNLINRIYGIEESLAQIKGVIVKPQCDAKPKPRRRAK